MSDIKIGDYVKAEITDSQFKILQVKTINGDQAVCIDYLNENQEFTLSISKLIKINNSDDDTKL